MLGSGTPQMQISFSEWKCGQQIKLTLNVILISTLLEDQNNEANEWTYLCQSLTIPSVPIKHLTIILL
jgi:hypothetical protein